jgi:hypothetical protein
MCVQPCCSASGAQRELPTHLQIWLQLFVESTQLHYAFCSSKRFLLEMNDLVGLLFDHMRKVWHGTPFCSLNIYFTVFDSSKLQYTYWCFDYLNLQCDLISYASPLLLRKQSLQKLGMICNSSLLRSRSFRPKELRRGQ